MCAWVSNLIEPKIMEILILVFQPKENYCDIMVSVESVSLDPDEPPVSKKYFGTTHLKKSILRDYTNYNPLKETDS